MNFEKLDRARIAAALVAAVITGAAALYGVYVKSREATAAGYETLAPEINDLKTEMETIRRENEQLRDALSRATGTRVVPPPTGTEGRTVARRRRATEPAERRATGPADAGAPTASAEPPPPPSEQPPPASEPDVIAGIKKRVPIDFDKAVRIWKDVQSIRKTSPPPQK